MKFELLKKNSSYSINAYNQNYFVVFHYINYNNIFISTDIESNTKMYFPLEDMVSINESFSKIDLEINSINYLEKKLVVLILFLDIDLILCYLKN